ncbi:hypothetical protein [Yersinia kristensenii]|uniref:hypothetical protein n=1 Tax=Yersinia kristensenii TaxID=28152 RepID=UPI001561DD36|nr:hypothetical protein [Yersinia kristensenii]QKJ17333.1 hypothetical protein HRD70_20410 [Yersinia kristensenii]
MTDEIKTGGLAFPFNDIGGDCDPGMTLHDYFAAKAMAAIISGSLACGQPFNSNEESDRLAQAAGRMADAMIKARG